MKKIKYKFGINLKTLFLVYLLIAVMAGTAIGLRALFSPSVENINSSIKTVATVPTVPKPEIKTSALLEIPFTVQAPLDNWNIHEESCEEAGLLMVHYYLDNITVPNGIIPKATANTELIDMKNWQLTHYGKEADLNMTALGQLAKDYYKYNFEVKKNISENDIKAAISAGNAVFVPVITHGLQNTMYGRQPSYHVLLIRGYDETGVITNDSGVGNGQGHHYSWDIVWQAVDQQTAKMNQGRDMVVISR